MRAMDNVLLARSKACPAGQSFIDHIFTGFVELHGDRRFGDDRAIIGGLAYLGDIPVTVIASEKGGDAKDRASRNFGSAHPEGYRKALRLMKQAEKFRRPVICLINTSGAFCGIGAEERGQGQAIAENLMEMTALQTPIISILTGEGGSGGALALAVANEVWMLERSVYSVISPEGCASILYRDAKQAELAAENLKLTADHLYHLGVIDAIVSDENYEDTYRQLRRKLLATLPKYTAMTPSALAEHRRLRFRAIGANF